MPYILKNVGEVTEIKAVLYQLLSAEQANAAPEEYLFTE